MNFPWRGGFLFLLLAAQDPAPARPDLVSRYAAILENGPESRRDLAARALLTLGRPGHDALRRVLAAKPELAKSVIAPGDQPPPLALVRITPSPDDEKRAREAATATVPISNFSRADAEPFLWEALDSRDAGIAISARTILRELYTPPPLAPPGRPSPALRAALDRKRDFDVTDGALTAVLHEEPISWILMSPRDERVTLRLSGVTLRDFFRLAVPKLAAVPVGDLLILIPPDRIATAEPGDAVWAPSDLAPRIEAALDALAKGEEGPIHGLTGAGVYHALKRAARSGGEKFSAKAGEMRKQLETRLFFIGDDGGPPLTLSPTGATAQATVAAFEKAAGFAIEISDKSKLDGAPPAFRFRGVPARLAARALAFRLNRIF